MSEIDWDNDVCDVAGKYVDDSEQACAHGYHGPWEYSDGIAFRCGTCRITPLGAWKEALARENRLRNLIKDMEALNRVSARS